MGIIVAAERQSRVDIASRTGSVSKGGPVPQALQNPGLALCHPLISLGILRISMLNSTLTRRRRWPIFLPSILLILVAGGWSVFWFLAADRAGTEIDRALARQAAAGRPAECGNRQIGGYPFRIEVRCAPIRLAFQSANGPLVFEAPGFVAVAQLPIPNRLIAEMQSPATLGGGGARLSLSFSTARASVRGSPSTGVEALSVDLKTPVLERIDGERVQVGLTADGIEVHTRRPPEKPPGTWDLVARLAKAQAPAIESTLAQSPSNVELQVSLSEADLLAPMPSPARLRAFAGAGGKLHLALLRVEQGDVVAEAKGDLSLDPQGLLDGDATVTVVGMQQVLAKASEAGLGWMWGLLPLGRAGKLGDRPAATYTVRVVGGTVSVGPLRFASLPPLF